MTTKQPKTLETAIALHQQGNLNDAEQIYKDILQSSPDDTTCWTNLGTIELQRGNLTDAIKLINKSLSLDPNQANAYNNRGNALRELDLLEESMISYDKGLAINNLDSDLLFNRASVLHELNFIDAALDAYNKVIDADGTNIKAYINRGNILNTLNKKYEAINDYTKVIEIQPNFAIAYINRGIVYHEMTQLDKALENYNISLDIEPTALVYSNRGNIYQEKHNLEEAIVDYDKAIELDPTYTSAHSNRANALLTLRRIEEASISYTNALTLDPTFSDSLWNKSILLLVTGQYEEGFKLFENRWNSALKHKKRSYTTPLWLGNEPLKNKTIFIYPEQGYGDFIHFCRYLPMLDQLGANVILEVPSILMNLIRTLKCNAILLPSETTTVIPSHDYQCPIMSLPLAFKTTLESIPASIPYLYVDKIKKQYWADKLGTKTKPRVGLVWSGGFRNDEPQSWAANSRRNVQLASLECFKDADVEFYSLQKGIAAEQELEILQQKKWDGPNIISYVSELSDFADTAALIDNLDLVITVDTATAHLVAAIGKPVWIFNRFDSCWRWLHNRTDSPWYPTVTLFNQQKMNEWSNVVDEMLAKLKQL